MKAKGSCGLQEVGNSAEDAALPLDSDSNWLPGMGGSGPGGSDASAVAAGRESLGRWVHVAGAGGVEAKHTQGMVP